VEDLQSQAKNEKGSEKSEVETGGEGEKLIGGDEQIIEPNVEEWEQIYMGGLRKRWRRIRERKDHSFQLGPIKMVRIRGRTYLIKIESKEKGGGGITMVSRQKRKNRGGTRGKKGRNGGGKRTKCKTRIYKNSILEGEKKRRGVRPES